MQADEARVEDLGHGALAQAHEALGDAEAAVRAHDAQAGDVAVLHAVGRIFFHLGQYVADDFGILWGCFLLLLLFGAAVLLWGADDGDERELRPGQRVVEVVFEKVVFRQVGDVAGLDGGEEGDVGGVGA